MTLAGIESSEIWRPLKAVMKIEIKTNNIRHDELVREFVEQKVYFSLDRLDIGVNRVVVQVENPRNHQNRFFEGNCQIEVEFRPSGQIHVSATGESPFDCVLQAVQKVEQAVKNNFNRDLSSPSPSVRQ